MIWLNYFHSESDSTSQVITTIYLGKMIKPATIICIAQQCPQVIYFREIYSLLDQCLIKLYRKTFPHAQAISITTLKDK